MTNRPERPAKALAPRALRERVWTAWFAVACSALILLAPTRVRANDATFSPPATTPAAPPTAQAPAGAASPPAAPSTTVATASAPALTLFVNVGASTLDRERIRAAIARELGVSVSLADNADATLRVSVLSDARLNVAYTSPAGEVLERTVDLPTQAERAEEVIALMAGNLSRDEAAELLASLTPKAAPNEASAPATIAAAPPPKPAALPKKPAPPRPEELRLHSDRPGVNASLLHPIALLPDSEKRVLALELSLLHGRVGAIQGMGLALGGITVEHQVDGAVYGMGFTRVTGPLRGLQASAFYSEGRGSLQGIASSGLVLYHPGPALGLTGGGLVTIDGDLQGASVSGIFGLAHDVRGMELSGLVSLVRGDLDGLLISGVFHASQRTRGIGLSGVAARSRSFQGLSVASVANVTGELDGVSLGLVNVGGNVRGVQIGLVNVAGELDGLQLGLANFARNGDTQLEAFSSNLSPANLGVKFRTGYAYSELGIGSPLSNREYSAFGGLGAHLPLGKFAIEPGARVSVTDDANANNSAPKRTDVHAQVRLSFALLPFFEPFVGGGARRGVHGVGLNQTEPEVFAGVAIF